MKNLLVLMVAMIFFTVNCYAENDVFGKDKELDACSSLGVSQMTLSCIVGVSVKRHKEYEKQFEKFISAVTKNKKYLDDADGYLKKVKSAKKNWDRYVEDECSSERIGYEDTESSGAQSGYSLCLIERYNQRIKYYKQQEEQYSF